MSGTRRLSLLAATVALAGCTSTGTTSASRPSTPASAHSTGASASASATIGTPAAAPTSEQDPVPDEKNPPGDIPDNLAFIAYANTAGRYRFTHPEGWAERTRASTVTFTDKLNGVQVTTGTATTVPTVATAKQRDVPLLARTQAAFDLRSVSAVSEPAGTGVRIVYRRNSAPDLVTGRQYRDEVERYELVSGGREVIMELFGPVGADNVDAYRTMISSLRLR
jgi:hypothetical protein